MLSCLFNIGIPPARDRFRAGAATEIHIAATPIWQRICDSPPGFPAAVGKAGAISPWYRSGYSVWSSPYPSRNRRALPLLSSMLALFIVPTPLAGVDSEPVKVRGALFSSVTLHFLDNPAFIF
jgi:hypothetical protein